MNFKPYLEQHDGGSDQPPEIGDAALLDCARRAAVAPGDAQRLALEQGILPARYRRNLQALSFAEQRRICFARALVCGCGGLGGTVLSLLARLGVGFLRCLDPDRFEASNLNRQWFADTTRIGESKAAAAREGLERINPFCTIDARSLALTEAEASALVADIDLVVDALDNIPDRLILARAARAAGVPMIHGAVAGWWGQLLTLMPNSAVRIEAVYGARRSRAPAEQALGVLGATAAVIGGLEAMEATRLLAGRAPAHADRLLYFDGETGTMEQVPLA